MEGRADAEQVPPPQPASSRATMDHLAALLSERLPQLLSATELHFRIALLLIAADRYSRVSTQFRLCTCERKGYLAM